MDWILQLQMKTSKCDWRLSLLGSWLFVLEAFSFSWTLRLERGRLSWRHTGLGHQNRPSQIMMYVQGKERKLD